MAESNTPRKNNLIDSLLNTPEPQATSTIARIKNPSSKIALISSENRGNIDKFLNNKRDSTNSATSAAESSLGILQIDQLEDISQNKNNCAEQDLFKKPLQPRKSYINEKLERERQLAQKTLERVSLSNLSKRKSDEEKGFPSYLLRAQSLRSLDYQNSSGGSTPPSKLETSSSFSFNDENDSTNKSASSSKLSFAEKDFSARSSLANKNESISKIELSDLEEIEDINRQIEELKRNYLSLSQTSLKHSENKRSCRLSEQSLQSDISENFVPAELAQEKMLQDDLSWMREKGLPIPNCDITAASISEFETFAKNLREKSISGFFREKCVNLSDISLGNCTEKSENVSKNPIPLIDESIQSVDSKDHEKSVNNDDIKSRSNGSNILSLTSIARALEEMSDDSPNKLINRMFNTCKQATGNLRSFDKENQDSQESSTLHSASTFQYSNSNNNLSKILKDMTNLTSSQNYTADIPSRLSRTSTKTDLQQKIETVTSTPTLPSPQSHQKNIQNYSPLSSRVAESPSRTLTELNISSDNSGASSPASIYRGLEDDPNSWILIKADDLKLCTQVPIRVKLTMFSKCNRWVLIKISFKEIALKNGPTTSMIDGILQMDIPVTPVLIEPNKVHEFEFEMVALIPAHLSLVLSLLMTDMVTKDSYSTVHTLNVTSVAPKISVKGVDNDVIDFDVIPEEGYKEVPITICNESDVNVPLILSVEQQDGVFYLSTGNKSDCKLNLNTTLRAKEERIMNIAMIGPNIQGNANWLVKEFSSRILINTGSRNNYKFLKEIKTFGRVGIAKIEFETNEKSLQVSVDGIKRLTIKNTGILSMHLTATFLKESLQECLENIFSIEPKEFTLSPGQRLDLNISYQNCKYSNIKRILLLKEKFGRTFKYPIQIYKTKFNQDMKQRSRSPLSCCIQSQSPPYPDTGTYSRISNNSDERASSAASSVSSAPSTQSYRSTESQCSTQLKKLPLVANRIEVIWGCVKIGRAVSDDIVIRNESNRRLKLTASISGSSFKFQKDVSSESDTVINLTLHPNETRTLIVTFSPNQIGAKYGKINFMSADNITKNIRLLGYGGHMRIDLVGVSKDTSGHMWFSLGSYNQSSSILEQNFLAKNTGTISGFLSMKRMVTSLLPIDETSITIAPENLVLKPGEERKIYISYNLKRKNLRDLFKNKDVGQIATISLYMGPEPTRYRIRNILTKTKLNGDALKKYTNLDKLLNVEYENEQALADVSLCRKETSDAIVRLLKDIEIRTMYAIAEKNSEHSILTSDFDETLLYQSLDTDQTTIMEATMLPQIMNQTPRRISHNKCYVEPDILTFILTSKMYNQFVITSEHTRPMHFQIQCKPHYLMHVSPSEGIISPKANCCINVYLTENTQPQTGSILVYVENEVLSISVKVSANLRF